MNFQSPLIEEAVAAFSKFPGIGKKTALRLTLHLLKQSSAEVLQFSSAVNRLKQDIRFCKQCHNLSEAEICHICSNMNRDQTTVCIVADIRDILAIENTGQYKGLYHVLNGLISPLEGIGPELLTISDLLHRIENQQIEELIFALSATMEGDTTAYYIAKQVEERGLRMSAISRGISIGGELEYADEVTLARSIRNRIPFSKSF